VTPPRTLPFPFTFRAGLWTVGVLTAWAAAGTAADWPQFLGPTRDGVSAETGLSWKWPTGGPPRVWQVPLGAGWSAPVVVGERVLIFHRQGDETALDCLGAADGKRLWRLTRTTDYRDQFGFDEGPRATPTVAGGRVFVLGADGKLSAVDLATGRQLWGRELHTDYQVPQGYFGAAGSPLVEGKTLILNVGGRGAGIVALDAETGKEVWKATDDPASYASPIAATVNGTRHVFVFTREGLVALDPTTGAVRFRERWRSRMQASVNAATPLLIGDRLFVSACYGTGAALWRVRPDGVTTIWKGDDILSSHYSTAVHRDGHLYGSHGRQEEGATLRCVELATGKVRWEQKGFGCATLTAMDGRLLAFNEHGDLVAFAASPNGYHEEARAHILEEPCRSAFALANGRVYARDGKKLVCLDLRGR
jgi:outer membrane protein assembly factor BamB